MKSKLYRICTENINRSDVERIVSSAFDGFTLLEGRGYWQGASENALVIEIVSDVPLPYAVHHVASAIKTANKQQAVLVQSIDIDSELI